MEKTTKRSWRRGAWVAFAALPFAAAACQLPMRGGGESYTLQGDPWAARSPEGAGAAAKTGGEKPPGEAPAPASATKSDAPTVLEQLEEARTRAKSLEDENERIKIDVASLTVLVEQLKQENQSLAQLADASAQSRAGLDREFEKLQQEAKAIEARCRSLADDLLSERIQRVRVERELILAKVKEVENRDDGP